VLFNEPKLLKLQSTWYDEQLGAGFSALQRAEIAEIVVDETERLLIARFSALQRAEIAEILAPPTHPREVDSVSVLFNEPKLLKWYTV